MKVARTAALLTIGLAGGHWLTGCCSRHRNGAETFIRPNGAVYHKTYDAAGRVGFHAHAAGYAGCPDCPPAVAARR